MTPDPVFRSFLESAALDAREINAASRTLRAVPDPRRGRPPDTYLLVFEGLEHFRRDPSGRAVTTRDPIALRVSFPDDYLRAADSGLAYRVISLRTPIFCPNAIGPALCISGFHAGASLRSIAWQAYSVLSSRVYATLDALDPDAARFFAENPERVRALERPPLWSAPAARASRVVELCAGEAAR